ncbi:hypothetical protein SPRG_05430 [Saprolegnia parasitica CBS 223.65]|uniref:C2H2-type domain-containing protein n=1 Tax=Saprolegnia parasitica (strain CBS 223.65) TaxID=695850 RepID=A0A067CFF4_SAPPC|nr:hypothetical protein SPRG_05430 [Saprolegnia parasitica CBS 223.65]KDO29188.1 hypothetical protein SPRG_05430 [Saprolegnia parasitica CBS 223.65]|eukprot:XP_012200065.1 hypothetical protein SPRG_05430 [Saprolegnia parasitica CBS 223.65]
MAPVPNPRKPTTKIPAATKLEILERHSSGERVRDLALEYGVHHTSIVSWAARIDKIRAIAARGPPAKTAFVPITIATKVDAIARIQRGERILAVAHSISATSSAVKSWVRDAPRIRAVATAAGLDVALSQPSNAFATTRPMKRARYDEVETKADRSLASFYNDGHAASAMDETDANIKDVVSAPSAPLSPAWDSSPPSALQRSQRSVGANDLMTAYNDHTFDEASIKTDSFLDTRVLDADDVDDDDDDEKATVGAHSHARRHHWIAYKAAQRRCDCPRCVYARFDPHRVAAPATYACKSRGCDEAFSTQGALVAHQLTVHRSSVYPISKRSHMDCLETQQECKAAPPPTVYIFLQYDHPTLPPIQNVDVMAEHWRVKARCGGIQTLRPHEIRPRKRSRQVGVARTAKMEHALYNVFLEACSRWQWGGHDERQAQFEEAYAFYARCVVTKHHTPTNAPSFNLVGQGRNWLRSANDLF